MKISIPEVCLVVLVGPSGSGKSSFARKHFLRTEVISSDYCRGLISDDENDQGATAEAFDLLHTIAGKRLANQKLTVVDATNVKPEDRKPLVALARRHHCLPVAVVLSLHPKLCHERNQSRGDRNFGPHVVRQQAQQMRRSMRGLKREGFRNITILTSPEEIDTVSFERRPLWNNRRDDHGPFDIIGDVHGCFEELYALLEKLGYTLSGGHEHPIATPPAGRKAVFVGDLVDRGPNAPAVLRLAMNMVAAGAALCVPGNHEKKLLRKLRGRDVRLTHGLAETIAQLENEPPEFRDQVATFIDGLVSHYVLDDGKLVVAHAGLREDLQGRASAQVREFALYGETTGETDEFGLPVRYDWAADYRGSAMVVYGHTPVPEAEWLNRTICIDTGCVFGGKLTALQYPEKELCEVEARKQYYESAKPFPQSDTAADTGVAPRQYNDLLDIGDVQGKRILTTRMHRTVTIREENATAALEVMSRFAVDPRWLIYLPPTMSPSETHPEGDYLEHPTEAFAYFRNQGVPRVICEEKHMGSRAVVIVCRSEAVATKRFGIGGQGIGVVYTRTGRPFFTDADLEARFLDRIRRALDTSGLWDELGTSWVCIDAELMPWSTKAQELLRGQYAAVGSASCHALPDVMAALRRAGDRNGATDALIGKFAARAQAAESFVAAYRGYCWPVNELGDLSLAPFHLLATEGKVHVDRDHQWHMDTLAKLCRADRELLVETPYKIIDVTDPESEREGTEWWLSLTEAGGEGMVVKPLDWVVRGKRGLIQPAVKCRGREYLRIIYGPEYTAPEHIDRLRKRNVGTKRALALREFSLGLEALHRFVDREPLYRVHECAFGVLALESEPVDPRL
ncbi:MAG TPA: polynucleotide kinase-phosphatase [Kofleriaceae bacterium]|nr:polynucleotide kinase-phosphatase [Kofleriaceae bacterium]